MTAFRTSRFRAISSVYGKFEEVLIALPLDPEEYGDKQTSQTLSPIFKNLGDRVTFVIIGNYSNELQNSSILEVRERLGNDYYQAILETTFQPENHKIFIPTPLNRKGSTDTESKTLNPYIQDPFIVLQDQYGDRIIAESFPSNNLNTDYVAEQVASAVGLLMRPTELWIEGGNVLVGDDYALIGIDLLIKNRDRLYEERELDDKVGGASPNSQRKVRDVIAMMFKQVLGVRYITWVELQEKESLKIKVQSRAGTQLFFHIDLFLTLGGKHSSGKEYLLIGDLHKEYITVEDGLPETLLGTYDKDFETIREALNTLYTNFNFPESRTEGPKFECRRVPMGGRIVRSKAQGYQHRFVPFSFNNCLVECYQQVKAVYLPKYNSLEKFQNNIEREFHGIFSSITFVDYDLETLSLGGGSLNCLTKVMKRSIY